MVELLVNKMKVMQNDYTLQKCKMQLEYKIEFVEVS
jgi:hypothetical protein